MVAKEDRQKEELGQKDREKRVTSVARRATCQKIARPTSNYANAQTVESRDIWRGSADRQQSRRWAKTTTKMTGHNI